MRVRLVRRPGQPGTRTYVEQYGDRLICIRYRYDKPTKRRYKTIEIIVEDQPWQHTFKPDTLIAVDIGRPSKENQELRFQLHKSGGAYDWDNQFWRIRYADAERLGLSDHILGAIADLTAKQ